MYVSFSPLFLLPPSSCSLLPACAVLPAPPSSHHLSLSNPCPPPFHLSIGRSASPFALTPASVTARPLWLGLRLLLCLSFLSVFVRELRGNSGVWARITKLSRDRLD
ncbi:hypothetical protein Syun_024034 [Stephania yunnanensis]|uniref:Secreted protein n=1 Tax=Stephania yunnanensis TaxID=152371 RepID=A0AAP0FPT2_9MAGN